MYVQYVYDNNLRIAAKNTNRFHNEHFYTPDANGLLKEIYYRADVGHPGSFPTGRLSFTRDQSGLIQTVANDLAMTVNYDPDLQISSISHTLPQPFDESYTYDDNGNRVTSLANTFIYDDLNKLTESSTHEYTYDADGNMTSERNKLTGETKRYYWDSENRMIKYEHLASDISPVDTTALYKYDIYGRRIQKDVNGSVSNFMWEGDNISLELNSANQPIRKYFTEMGMDDYFAHLNYNEVTNWSQIFSDWYPQGWYGYIRDQVGTIYKVWDHNTRTIADSRTYDSFGNLVNQSGTTKTQLGFQGKYYDQESGLNYFYHRYYSPAIGRFTSEDPIKSFIGNNNYLFVSNNSISLIDPYGLTEECTALFSRPSEKPYYTSKKLMGYEEENGTWVLNKEVGFSVLASLQTIGGRNRSTALTNLCTYNHYIKKYPIYQSLIDEIVTYECKDSCTGETRYFEKEELNSKNYRGEPKWELTSETAFIFTFFPCPPFFNF